MTDRPGGLAASLGPIVRDRAENPGRKIEIFPFSTGLFEADCEVRLDEFLNYTYRVDGMPGKTLTELACGLNHLLPKRGHVDRYRRLVRLGSTELANIYLVMLAIVFEWSDFLTGPGHLHDVDQLPHLRNRMIDPDRAFVQVLTGRAPGETEDEAAFRQLIEVRRGDGGDRRSPYEAARDARAKLHLLGVQRHRGDPE